MINLKKKDYKDNKLFSENNDYNLINIKIIYTCLVLYLKSTNIPCYDGIVNKPILKIINTN